MGICKQNPKHQDKKFIDFQAIYLSKLYGILTYFQTSNNVFL